MPRLTVYWMFYLSTESMASIRCLYKRTTSYHLRTFPGKWTTQKSIRVRFYGVALMYGRLLSPGGLRFSWHWVWSPGPALITLLRAHSWRSQQQHVARSRPGQWENRWNVNWAHNISLIVECFIDCPEISASWLTSFSVTSELLTVRVWSPEIPSWLPPWCHQWLWWCWQQDWWRCPGWIADGYKDRREGHPAVERWNINNSGWLLF